MIRLKVLTPNKEYFKLIFFSFIQVIRNELYRNLGLAFLCVFVVTLLLIANIWTCLLVGSCVVLTLVSCIKQIVIPYPYATTVEKMFFCNFCVHVISYNIIYRN